MSDTKINPYSINDLKNTTDDALGNYLRGLSFKQDNSKLDVKLGAGYLAVAIAAAIFVADYKLGWEATKTWTACGVAAYTLLNGFYTYWQWYVEKGLVFEGLREGKTVSIASKTEKHDPTYYLTVTTSSPNSTPSTWQLKCPFTTWFTADGYFVAKPFQQWLASSVSTIGEFDTKHSARDEKEELHKLAVESVVAEATGADAKAGGSKRGKKKA